MDFSFLSATSRRNCREYKKKGSHGERGKQVTAWTCVKNLPREKKAPSHHQTLRGFSKQGTLKCTLLQVHTNGPSTKIVADNWTKQEHIENNYKQVL